MWLYNHFIKSIRSINNKKTKISIRCIGRTEMMVPHMAGSVDGTFDASFEANRELGSARCLRSRGTSNSKDTFCKIASLYVTYANGADTGKFVKGHATVGLKGTDGSPGN